MECVVGLFVVLWQRRDECNAAVPGLLRLVLHGPTQPDTGMCKRHGQHVERLVVVVGVQCDMRERRDDAIANVRQRDVRNM